MQSLCNSFIVAHHAINAMQRCVVGDVIECGVYEGITSSYLNIVLRRINTKFAQFAADTFEGFADCHNEQQRYKVGDLAPQSKDLVIKELRRLGIVPLIGRVEKTLPTLSTKFCFAFIDLDVYAPTKFAWNYLQDKILPGGIVGFHDYKDEPGYSLPGPTVAVKEILQGGEWQEVLRNGKHDNKFIFLERKK